MFHEFVDFILNMVQDWGYLGVFILMIVESSFIPFPSEVIIVPAGYLASQGKMNLYYIILLGTLGSLIGALINYYLALFVGRNFIIKFGKYFLINEDKLDKTDYFFKKHGVISTFIGRLIPMIRQLISVPAGLSRMNIFKFSIFTCLGAGIWVTILALLGYFLGENEDLIKQYLQLILLVIAVLSIIIIAIYIFIQKKKNMADNANV